MTNNKRDECKDCGDSDCPWHLFDRFLAGMKALVPEAGESNALCETCDGALDGCAVCVGGIKPDIIERVHKQGQRDMLAKVLKQLRRRAWGLDCASSIEMSEGNMARGDALLNESAVLVEQVRVLLEWLKP